jgi:type II secretory pathway pseudopilin PulG
MKSSKQWGLGPRKSGGFTLIELLTVLSIIIIILVGVVALVVGGSFGAAQSNAYDTAKHDIQNAVVAYATANQGDLPYNTSVTMGVNANCSSCYILNMSALLTINDGMLRKIPDGCLKYGGADNCDGVPAAQTTAYDTCNTDNHYIWGADANGNVYSFCENGTITDKLCLSNNSGYQGVWP